MHTITVSVGTFYNQGTHSSAVDGTKDVQFVGEELAQTYYEDRSRGYRETLYRLESGDYIVHVDDFSGWQGESSTASIIKATAEDLFKGGRFETLARKAKLLTEPYTLDEYFDSI